jgi:hypothetical protein
LIKPAALMLCLGIVIALAAACTQQMVAGLAGPTLLVPSCADQGITDGASFVQKRVFFLSPSFDPTAGGSPTSGQITAVTPPYSHDVAAAWIAAPPFFQDRLCDLDGVFIVQNTCSSGSCTPADAITNSWGFRGNSLPAKRYIATSQQLWYNVGQVPGLAQYETDRLEALLETLSPTPKKYNLATYKVQPNNGTMTVLAALAHEYGHVLWYDTFVINADGSPNLGGRANIAGFCGGNFYPNGSWQYTIDVPSGRWIGFGEVLNQSGTTSEVLQIPGLLNQFPLYAGDHLFKVYSNPRWPSLLAAFSPDEEFVETFQLFVLRNAATPLTNSNITITGNQNYPPIGILGNFDRTKMMCFKSLCPSCTT